MHTCYIVQMFMFYPMHACILAHIYSYAVWGYTDSILAYYGIVKYIESVIKHEKDFLPSVIGS